MPQISEARMKELGDDWNAETNDPETEEWRDDLTPQEAKIIADWDYGYADGMHQLCQEIMLEADLKKYEKYVLDKAYCPITASLTQNQFDALVSFTYNCGGGCLKTLCKDRTAAQIAAKLPLYNKSGGQAVAGLTRRRMAEQALFNT